LILNPGNGWNIKSQNLLIILKMMMKKIEIQILLVWLGAIALSILFWLLNAYLLAKVYIYLSR
jgi:hypothetical protein